MELPIRIVITLFVLMAVAGLIIMFSQRVLDQADDGLRKWADDPANIGNVIEVDAITAVTIRSLADDCVGRNVGENFERTVCFAIFANSFESLDSMHNAPLRNDFRLDTIAVTGMPGLTAVKIVYDPLGTVWVEP